MNLFIETNPRIDEYQGQAIGLFLPNGFCLLGILTYPGQFGIIVLNICIGIWSPED